MATNNYVNNKETNKLLAISNTKELPKKNYPTFLYKRIDLAQHFIASAAITSSINGQIAKAVGEEKELNDANGGSGFSFIDLAADKAGTRITLISCQTPEIFQSTWTKLSLMNVTNQLIAMLIKNY